MSVLSAAKTLGEVSGWSLTKLAMQKTLYIAQMLHLGRTGVPAFPEAFQAWELGPVVRELHDQARVFRYQPVHDVFDVPPFGPGSSREKAVRDAYHLTRHMTAGQLVTYTHRPGGAWEASYREGRRDTVIPIEAILSEWKMATQPSAADLAWANEMADEVEANPSKYLDSQDERAFRASLRGKHLQ